MTKITYINPKALGPEPRFCCDGLCNQGRICAAPVPSEHAAPFEAPIDPTRDLRWPLIVVMLILAVIGSVSLWRAWA